MVLAVPGVERDDLTRALDCPASFLEQPQSTVIKKGLSSFVVRSAVRLDSGDVPVAFKRIRSKDWLKRLLRRAQTNRAIRNFRLALEFLRSGILTPRPILAIAPHWYDWVHPSYLATEWIEGALPIDKFVYATRDLPPAESRSFLRRTAAELGSLLGRMHAAGFSHRDLKSTNVLARNCAGQIELFLLDLDGASRNRVFKSHVRLLNLTRLVIATDEVAGITHAIRLRVLLAYLANLQAKTDWKIVWRQLVGIYRIRAPRRRRRGRS